MGSQQPYSPTDNSPNYIFTPCSSLLTLFTPTTSCEVIHTHGAVGSHPVGVTATQPSVWYESPVAMALVWALGPGQLAVEPSPAWLTVALPIHTDAIVGTCGIQAIHCIKQEIHQCKKEKQNKMNDSAHSS